VVAVLPGQCRAGSDPVMDAFAQEVFLNELIVNCAAALNACEALATMPDYRPLATFSHVQTFLGAASNIANVLFPHPPDEDKKFKARCKQRGMYLYKLLALPETRLFDNRMVRHGYMHADERLQRWLETSPQQVLRDYTLIYGDPPEKTDRYLHWYATGTGETGFGEHLMNLPQCAKALQLLDERARGLLPIGNSFRPVNGETGRSRT
jgi:hypothetical protein